MTRKRLLDKECPCCSTSFHPRHHYTKCCSVECRGKMMRKGGDVECAYCGKKFHKPPNKQKLSRSGLYFCCREHKDLAQRIGGIKAIQPDHYRNGVHYTVQAFRHLANKCNRCGYDEEVRILNVHHRDYNRDNNQLDNLEILCPNCHAIEHRILNRKKTFSKRWQI